MHPVYLPFWEAQLRGHFVEIAGDARADPERHLAYYRQSIKRVVANLEQPALTPADVRRARAVAAAHQIHPDLLAGPRQIPGRLKRRPGHRDRRERTGHQLAQQMLGVPAVVLDLLAARAVGSCSARSPHRRSPPPWPPGKDQTLSARLIARTHRPRQGGKPLHHRLHRPGIEPPTRQLVGRHVQRRSMDRARVDIHRRSCHRSGHGRSLLRMGSAGAHLRPVKPPQYVNGVRPSTFRRVILIGSKRWISRR